MPKGSSKNEAKVADYIQVVGAPTQVSPFDTIITKLEVIESKIDELNDKVDQLEQRVLEIDLPTGDGFERETY